MSERISESINSFIIALSITINVVYATITTGLKITGVVSILIMSVYVIGFIAILVVNKGKFTISKEKTKKYLLFHTLFFSALIITYLFAKVSSHLSIETYFWYCFFPTLFLLFKYDVEKILRYGMYVSLISAISINSLLADSVINLHFAQASIGVVYDLFPCVILALFHFTYYRDKANVFTKICYVYFLFVLFKMLFVIVRGAMVTLLIGFVFIFFNKSDRDFDTIKEWSISKKIIFCLLLFFGVMVLLNFNSIIIWLYTFLANHGINFGVISKFYVYIMNNNLSDNRDPFYDIVFTKFKESPLWGNGIQTFYAYTADGTEYPHSFVLQFLFEGGLLMVVPATFFSFREIYRVVFSQYKEKDSMVFSACLLLVSVIPCLFSLNVWFLRSFWLLLMYSVLSNKSCLKEKKIQLA